MIAMLAAAVVRLSADVPPLTPSGPTAQEWLRHELARPEYQAAKPTWFDRVAQEISNWFSSLGTHVSGDAGWILASIGIAIAAAAVIGAFVVFGMPRLSRRASAREVFDGDDGRSVEDQRRDAASAASAGDYPAAVLDQFRVIARSLGERTIVLLLPGTTSQEVAAEASRALPAFADRARAAAALFDGVRYLGRSATVADYEFLLSLDHDLAGAAPLVAR